MELGKAIKSIREHAGESRSHVASGCGMTVSALCKIENGNTIPKWVTIEKICRFLNVPVAFLLAKSTDPSDFTIK